MGLRQCNDCKEMVDDARAFCDACGHPFVDEIPRPESSPFDRSVETVQFNDTMFGAILADMGLDLSNPPHAPEKGREVLRPLQPKVAAPIPAKAIARPKAAFPEPAGKAREPGNSNVKWFVLAGLGLALFLMVGLAVVILVLLYWLRLI